MVCRLLLAASLLVSGATAQADSSLKVFVCLDGVPLGMMLDLHDSGLFRHFRRPAPLISTFPAITEVMLTELYGVEKPPGYGLRYYDRKSNSLRGGISNAEAISVWFELYDYVTPMIDRGITYLWARWAWKDLDLMERRLREADSGILLMHLDTSDAMMHHNLPSVTSRWLVRLDEILSRYLETGKGRRTEIVLFSDHGNDRTPCRRIEIEKHLKKKGYHPGNEIEGESGVVILPTGLISAAYLYTHREEAVAEALADLPGLDMAFTESGGRATIVSRRGRAEIDHDAVGNRFRYRTVTGDPLRLETAARLLLQIGEMDADGYAGDAAWSRILADHEYPDALHRIWGGVTGHVENVGDVMMSLEKGWQCGSKALGFFFKFKGTHGSLLRDSITGFAVSNRRELPALRAEDLLGHLAWKADFERAARARGVSVRGDSQR